MLNVHVAVLISGGGTNLQALIDAQARGQLGPATIALVVSNRKAAYGLTRAGEAGIPCAVVSKHMFPDPHANDRALYAHLTEHKIDMIALGGFLGILGERVLRAYMGRIVNIHPALIPSFCGMGFYGLRVHEAALERGVKLTGATAHLVNGEVDGGPILMQTPVEVKDGDTPETLQRRVMEQGEWALFPKAVRMIAEQILAEKDEANDNV